MFFEMEMHMKKGRRKRTNLLRFESFLRLVIYLAVAVIARGLPAVAQIRSGKPITIVYSGDITVYPAEIAGPIPNPYMGLGLWVGPRLYGMDAQKHYTVKDLTTGFGDNAPLFNWVMVDWDWASLEPREGEFNWKEFDTVIRYWSQRGKQLVVRLWVTDDAGWYGHPGEPVLPEWLWKKGLKSDEYMGLGGKKVRAPDYTDPSFESVYLPALRQLETSFAERYDKPNTPVIFLQATGYGDWVDWAAWYSKVQFPSMAAKHNVLASVMQTYIERFHHIQLFETMSSDGGKKRYSTLDQLLYSKAMDVAAANNFGFIGTGFIDSVGTIYSRGMERFWRHHPMFAEGNWSYDMMEDEHTHGTLDENVDGAVEWHSNFFHLYFAPDAYKRAIRKDRAGLERALEANGIGYRLVPTSLSWPAQLPAGNLLVLHGSWVNRNAGRLYVAHPLKLYLTAGKGEEVFSEANAGIDETAWVKGQTYTLMSVFHLAKTIPPGTYDLRIALVDASGKPKIRLGIAGEDAQHRYRVGQIGILPPDAASGVRH